MGQLSQCEGVVALDDAALGIIPLPTIENGSRDSDFCGSLRRVNSHYLVEPRRIGPHHLTGRLPLTRVWSDSASTFQISRNTQNRQAPMSYRCPRCGRDMTVGRPIRADQHNGPGGLLRFLVSLPFCRPARCPKDGLIVAAELPPADRLRMRLLALARFVIGVVGVALLSWSLVQIAG